LDTFRRQGVEITVNGSFDTRPAAVASVSCGPAGYFIGDLISRGFYIPNYPGSALQSVALRFSGGAEGTGTLTLTAHAGAYNGPLIGSSTINVTGPLSSVTPLTFPFASNPTVSAGSTLAFSITASGAITSSRILYSVFGSF